MSADCQAGSMQGQELSPTAGRHNGASLLAVPTQGVPPQAGRGRFPSLDGLRAISIAMVLFAHCIGTSGCPLRTPGALGDLGALGVRVFFVISGFLITALLLQEVQDRHRVDLARFYLRRGLRILPAAYLFIATIALLDATGLITVRPHDLIHAVAYTMNYHADHGWYLGHLWSLAVEEQFYLLWPAIIALAGVRRAMWAALLTIALCPLVRLGMIYLLGTYVGINRVFPAVADALATGCLLAGMRCRLEGDTRYMAVLRSRWLLLLPLGVFVWNALMSGHPTLMSAIGATGLNLSIAVCVHMSLLLVGGRVVRILNSRPFVATGVLSYSLYLWQQLFLNRSSSHWLNSFPLNVLLAIATATASYMLVERPLLRLRERLRPVGGKARHAGESQGTETDEGEALPQTCAVGSSANV